MPEMHNYSQLPVQVSHYASSVGCLIDRCLSPESVLGTAWLVDTDKVVTCAHLVVLYMDCLPALKLRFPAAGEERAVSSVFLHPKFNFRVAEQMARKALSQPMPALALQEYNLAVLSLGGGPADLSAEVVALINEKLSCSPPPRDKGLGGSLTELDLPLVIQTITNARKEGTLVLSDERNRPLARLFCRDGKIFHALYGPLSNEKAIYQITSQHLTGEFYFNSKKGPDWPAETGISRPTDMLLIESLRRLDEIPKLLLALGGDTTIYQRSVDSLNVEVLSPDIRADALALWPFLDGGVPTGHLWKLAGLDDYAVFLSLVELLRTNHIREVSCAPELPDGGLKPLPVAPELPLSPFDEIQNLTVDPLVGHAFINAGHLLGSLRPGDPWHLLHNLTLPADAAGSPIFKEGQVIGLHCGILPPSPHATSGTSRINQLLWVESVFECLGIDRNGNASAGASVTRTLPVGCTEVARIDCPRCGTSSLDSAKFCKSCGKALIQDLDVAAGGLRKGYLLAAVAAAVIVLAGAGFWLVSAWHGKTAVPVARPATQARLTVSLLKADQKTAKWESLPLGTTFHNGDLVALKMQLFANSFLYVFHQGATPGDISLMFPETAAADIEYSKGSTLTIPRETTIKVPGGAVSLSGLTVTGPPCSESLIYLVSDKPSNLYTVPTSITKAYAVAVSALGDSYSPKAVTLPTTAFGEEIFPGCTRSENKGEVYITRIQITHRD